MAGLAGVSVQQMRLELQVLSTAEHESVEQEAYCVLYKDPSSGKASNDGVAARQNCRSANGATFWASGISSTLLAKCTAAPGSLGSAYGIF